MPLKRALAEADPNVTRPGPSNKCAKTNHATTGDRGPRAFPQYQSKGTSPQDNGTGSQCGGRVEAIQDEKKSHMAILLQPLPDGRILYTTTGLRLANFVDVDNEEASREGMTYNTKDNSKVGAFLRDRKLSTTGTREELILRLEGSSINYEDLSSGDITGMLQRRHVTCAATGSKDVKIQRLRINDELDYDTGNSEEATLYGKLMAHEDVLESAIAEQKAGIADNMNTAQLSARLAKRNLSQSGSHSEKTNRLRELLSADIKRAAAEIKSRQSELESRIGHPTKARETYDEYEEQRARDYGMKQAARSARPGQKVCSYDIKDSHWASKTQRELSEICARRGMPGHGPKAALIKWLETGELEYEDNYAFVLERMCTLRGICFKKGEKKVDLMRFLKEVDAGEARRDGMI